MKGAEMYHKIKSLREEYSQRECSRQLGISLNTMRKYDQMSLEEASSYLKGVKRSSQFDEVRPFILEELKRFPRISSSKLLRKIKKRYPHIQRKERALRHYIAPLREAVKPEKIRYYQPVLDMEPARQVQVDIGEAWVLQDDSGKRMKVYFVSFVFSYSRQSYVTFQGRPYNTDSFIDAHIQAFIYFGGIAEEYVYDQTKLVVISERYREVFLNERFYQFSLKCGFSVRVCEGYDPESKGRVENHIGYTKSDFLYGDYYKDIDSLNECAIAWLNEVANKRVHGFTHQVPEEQFEKERPFLKELPEDLHPRCLRQVDKTGLISFEGNKYSVPFKYQRQKVWIKREGDHLIICDRFNGKKLTGYELMKTKGNVIKNNNHYRDYRKSIEEITKKVEGLFSDFTESKILIERLKAENPSICRDQLRGLQKIRHKYSEDVWRSSLKSILGLPMLRISKIEIILNNHQLQERLKAIDSQIKEVSEPGSSCLDRPLEVYMEVLENA